MRSYTKKKATELTVIKKLRSLDQDLSAEGVRKQIFLSMYCTDDDDDDDDDDIDDDERLSRRRSHCQRKPKISFNFFSPSKQVTTTTT